MRIIVPMAGRGSRLRPHTLTTPKPLLPVAGKPIVQRLVEDLARIYNGPVEEIVFIIGDFGKETEEMLLDVAARLGSTGRIAYQDKPLGTAHALSCAGDSLNDEIIIAFADTLFTANFTLDKQHDGVIWVKQVADPRAFGVVTLNADGVIDQLVEKPQEFVSDLAIIGIYYVKDGAALNREIQHLLDNDLKTKGEFQLTDALESLKAKGAKFTPGQVDEWMDCGNKENLLETNQKVLGFQPNPLNVDPTAKVENSVLIPPVYLGPGASVYNSVVGPNVAIGQDSIVENAIVKDSILQANAQVAWAVVTNSIISQHASALGVPKELNLGDYASSYA